MSESNRLAEAAEYFRQAYARQTGGDFDEAIRLYTRSIEAFPTAEAYTFRGWTYSFLGDYDRAIAECLEAIKVDSDFGNPYNDIGAYLIEQGKWEDAVPWFKKAMLAKRYEARCYPYFNLGRVFEHQYKWEEAKKCYAQAYAEDKRYVVALGAFRRLQTMWN